jgi:ATP-dependent DNA helicase RecQ
MNSIAFIDTEIEAINGKILDVGGIKDNGSTFHSGSLFDFSRFIQDVHFICGHNIIHHDLKYLKNWINSSEFDSMDFIDTLYFSPLLFPSKPYHALLKDDKLQTEELNNPLNDSIKAKDLFFDEVSVFQHLNEPMKLIYYNLLRDKKEFCSFFKYVRCDYESSDLARIIRQTFYTQICEEAPIDRLISNNPIELAYCLALINTNSRYSITPPWVIKNYPAVQQIMHLLRGTPCLKGCSYCNETLNIHASLKRFFGFDSYKKYAGEPLQEKAVKAAIDNKSLLAVFPTGGGKSITFQVPALMNGISSKGLTVVISPLQSLMKDQVDNLEKVGITAAVTINGLLDPIERAKSFERVENGSASILYISPESLRSRTIEKLLIGRNISRFVIDEAHCFSAWGQDFRIDYLYIGDFIKMLQDKKNLDEPIPVSCFTATAKPQVIEDIRAYFQEKLSLDLKVFSTSAARSNLHFSVFVKQSEEEKYYAARDLIETKNCPTIIYVSRTKKAYLLAQRLTQDGYPAKPYHGKMDKKEKSENQDAFIKGEIPIMVATSAFGMGVDKKDVGMVIHYEISDSLENYIQEAGRAGRDESISANCFVLFNEDDLGKHFALLNQTKISIQEIQQVWKAIKELTKFRSRVSQSALEIARKAGWDDSIAEIETRVTTAISALEEAGYVKRGQNMPRIFANSILVKNMEEAASKIRVSSRFDEKQKQDALRVIKSLISSKSTHYDGDAESRVDYLSDRLGLAKEDVIQAINLMREEHILADQKDLAAYIKRKENKNHSLNIVKNYWQIEKFLLESFTNEEMSINIKELNERLEKGGCVDVTTSKIRNLINFWAAKSWIKQYPQNKNHISISCLFEKESMEANVSKRQDLAQFIIEYLIKKCNQNQTGDDESKEEVLVEFSVYELKQAYDNQLVLIKHEVTPAEVEDALFYLSKIEALKIEGGFLITYRGLDIERLEDSKRRYKAEDYQKLKLYYENKVQQIHIVGEYAKKMISDYKDALQFVDDYFRLNYSSFINKYFKGIRQHEIQRNVTPEKFRAIFGELSITQLKIINDKESKYIVVTAGPGSGKTRILVHKLASLLLMEDVKTEQLLMLTFSRAAATEFKKRLQELVHNVANYVEIKTFHSYCFDLLGKMGTLEKSDEIISETVKRIKNGEVEASRITKTVLVIDEAQDIDANEYALISALIELNEEMRVIAVGDDDQNIFEFRGASSTYMEQLIREKNAVVYEMFENFRSKRNIVDFSNQFVRKISHRLKKTPIYAVQGDLGKIKLTRYKGDNLIIPLVNDIISADLAGTSCVLTKTNEEALQITGLLLKNGLQAKLIQSNDGFSLYNLVELRYFLEKLNLSADTRVIDDQGWSNAKRALVREYQRSSNLEACINLIKDFETTNPRIKYHSDLEVFIRESKLEDFYREKTETIYVSTIHKAKGREYSNVYLMLEKIDYTNESYRLLYVAMTRAKNYLSIHNKGNFFDFIRTEGMTKVNDTNVHPLPDQLAIQLTHKDVWLDSFRYNQFAISNLKSGDSITVDNISCNSTSGKTILKFSKAFQNKIEELKKKGYIPKTGKVNFIIYWQNEEIEQEIKIVLPEIYFEKE